MNESSSSFPAFKRTVHLVFSSHWDREWYLPFQKFRGKLVNVLDEVLDELTSERIPFYQMDGQFIPVEDYLQIRPEKTDLLHQFIAQGRFKVGPWYNLPDGFLVSGESLVRNLLMGMKRSEALGQTSRVGWLADLFGHNSQMPQIFSQLGIDTALLWRGVDWSTATNPFYWQAADGTKILVHRFHQNGYVDFACDVRKINLPDSAPTVAEMTDSAVTFLEKTSKDSPASNLLWFDGGDHLEFDPAVLEVMTRLNERAGYEMIRISTLDQFMAALQTEIPAAGTVIGELRETAKMETNGVLIPGVGSSRIPLKQANHAVETLLTLWAEPWCAASHFRLGKEYPATSLELAWEYLLKNHPHDSICGCSTDETHAAMPYRFEQSRQIAEYHLESAFKAFSSAGLHGKIGPGELGLTLFASAGGTAECCLEVLVRLPKDWPQFTEFFAFESKPSLRIFALSGEEIDYQLLQVLPSAAHVKMSRNHFPTLEVRQGVRLALDLVVSPGEVQHLLLKRCEGPTRIAQQPNIGAGRNILRNNFLEVRANGDGTISITNLVANSTYSGLLALEDTADIGDGWFHGIALQERAYLSTGGSTSFGLTENGPLLARLHIHTEWLVPEEFDFHKNQRSPKLKALVVEHLITLRKGSKHVEVETTVQNSIRDHRLRLFCPTDLQNVTSFWADTPFDAVERPVKMRDDTFQRREIQVEMTPQQNWVATSDGDRGLALLAPGQYESAVLDQPDRPLCLTLFRAFRKAIFTDGNEGGQIQGMHKFRMAITPFTGAVPAAAFGQLAQLVAAPARSIYLEQHDLPAASPTSRDPIALPRIAGPVVLTSCLLDDPTSLTLRAHNPSDDEVEIEPIGGQFWRVTDMRGNNSVDLAGGSASLAPRQILTLRVTL